MTFPGAGNDVGSAYIRILADGSGLDESIKREFKEGEKGWRSAGNRAGKNYNDGFTEEMDRPSNATDRRNSLLHQLGKFDATSKKFGEKYGEDLRGAILSGIGTKTNGRDELADRIFGNLKQSAFLAGTTDVVERQLKDFSRLRAQAIRDIQRDELTQQRIEDQAARVREGAARKLNTDLNRLLEDRLRHTSLLNRRASTLDAASLRTSIHNATEDARLGYDEAANDLVRNLRRFNTDAEKGFARTRGLIHPIVRDTEDADSAFRRTDASVRRLADGLGTAFGRGSRNNFLNFSGSMIRNLSLVAGLAGIAIPHALSNMSSVIKEIIEESDGLGSTLFHLADAGFGALDKVVTKAIGGFVGFGSALGLVVTIAGPVAAAISLLAGGIVAVAGSLSFALAGAVGSLLPLLLPIVAGIGAVALGLSGMSDKAKAAAKKTIKPLTSAFNELRNVTRKGLFSDLPNQVKLLTPLVKQVTPLFGKLGKTVSEVGTNFAIALKGKGFQAFIKSLTSFLPGAIEKLGEVGTNVFTGMAGVFRALLPYASKLIDYLRKVTDNFDNFANSAAGQNKIKKFMDKSVASAKIAITTIKDLGKVIGDLFSAGQSTGDSLLQSINNSLEQFDTFLRSGRGKAALDNWFNDARKMFTFLGKAISGIGKLFDALDSTSARQILNTFLGFFGNIGRVVALLVDNFNDFRPQLSEAFNSITEIAISISRISAQIVKAVGPILIVALGSALKGLSVVLSGVARLLNSIADFIDRHTVGFKILATTVLAFWAAWRGYTIVTQVVRAVGGAVGNLRVQFANALASFRNMSTGMRASIAGIGGGLVAGSIAGESAPGGLLGKILFGAGGGAALGALGGPIGAAVGGVVGAATASFTDLLNVQQKNKDKAKQAAQAAQDAMKAQQALAESYAQSLTNVNSLLGEQARQNVAQTLSSTKIGNFDALSEFAKAGINVNDVITAITTGSSTLQLQLADSLAAAAKAGNITNAEYTALNGIFLKNKDAVAAASVTATTYRDVIAGTSIQVKALTKELAAQVKFSGSTTLDAETNSGKSNLQFLKDRINLLTKSAEKEFQNNEATLGSGQAAKIAATDFTRNAAALAKVFQKAGFAGPAVQDLARSFANLPADVKINLDVPTKAALDDLSTLQDKLLVLGKEKQTPQVKIQEAAVQKQINSVVAKLLAIGKVKPKPVVQLDESQLESKRISLLNYLGRLSTLKATPKVNADITQAKKDLAAVQRQLDALKSKTITVTTVTRADARGGGRTIAAAAGRLLTGPTRLLAGEAGPEAIVPLRRPLSQVDPAVRWLSAVAQGLNPPNNKFASGGVVGGGKSVTIQAGAITVVSPNDPVAVVRELMNELVGQGYS